jgi:hypothetical protein
MFAAALGGIALEYPLTRIEETKTDEEAWRRRSPMELS